MRTTHPNVFSYNDLSTEVSEEINAYHRASCGARETISEYVRQIQPLSGN